MARNTFAGVSGSAATAAVTSATSIQLSPGAFVQGARSSAISGVPVCAHACDRVAAHLGSEGMRGVDHMRDALTANIVGKPAHAAEAADAGRQRLIGGRAGSAAIGIHGVDARACDFRGEQARIGGSAQNEGARHG